MSRRPEKLKPVSAGAAACGRAVACRTADVVLAQADTAKPWLTGARIGVMFIVVAALGRPKVRGHIA